MQVIIFSEPTAEEFVKLVSTKKNLTAPKLYLIICSDVESL